LVLYNYASAHDPTWVELEAFLLSDKTDEILYVDGKFVCGDFAETLHNNAEASGIRAAFVIIWWENESVGHAINAFNTSDRGMVYIDDTGMREDWTCSADRIIPLVVEEAYIPVSIFGCPGLNVTWGNMGTVECFSVQW
jgi:hypothetical protein